MKKIIAVILTLIIITAGMVNVYAEDIYKIEGTDFFYAELNEGGRYICDENGNKLNDQLFYDIEAGGKALIVRYYGGEYNNKVTVFDMSFKPVIVIKYDYIDFNENTNCYECFYYDNDNIYRVDFYNDSFEKVLQSRDIRILEGTGCYYERVIGENNAHREYFFICDNEGNRIIEEGFLSIRAEYGNVVVNRAADRKDALLDREFNIVNDSFYDLIYFDENINCFELTNFVNDENGNTVAVKEYVNADFVSVNPIRHFEDSMYCTVEENSEFYICDENGRHLSDKPYYEIESIGDGYLKVRSSNKYPYKYGLLDVDLNTVIDEIYFNIENTGAIYCYNNGKTVVYNSKADKIINEYDNNIIYVTPIKGMEGKYVYDMHPLADIPNDSKMVIDDKGNCLTRKYLSISREAGLGDTLFVQKRIGMADTLSGILNSECKEIIPTEWYNVDVKEENGVVYIIANQGSDRYFDILGNEYGSVADIMDKNGNADAISDWAKESVEKAIETNIVPENLKGFYTFDITRGEFCQLAMQTYVAKTGCTIYTDIENPFDDVNDVYVTNAYNLKIVAGVGNNKFAPNNKITRQEAAVMLNNLAKLMNVEESEKAAKFADESYFADWAKTAVYSVAGMKSGDTYVMAGTGEGKFSPWMNYTREQAIVTMLRLYNCEEKELYYDGQYLQSTPEAEKIYGDWLYYDSCYVKDGEIVSTIVRLKKDGSEQQILVSNEYGLNFNAVIGEYIYYTVFDENSNYSFRKMKLDGTDENEITEDESKSADELRLKKAHDEKYQYFIEGEMFAGKTVEWYLCRSDLNGENAKRLIKNQVLSRPIVYEGYVYIIVYSDNSSIDIVRVDSDGNVENLTNCVEGDFDIQPGGIIKIDEGKIYYRRVRDIDDEYHTLYIMNDDYVYSMNINGDDNKLLYE
ncbi:MAG: S-layer homology domain-containing protein [Clostridia bacterium]|nr:S-layer homology domain-containing protein [Clostridia bacterium]